MNTFSAETPSDQDSANAFFLCHAAAWCSQSKEKLLEWRQMAKNTKNKYFAIEWDGPYFGDNDENGHGVYKKIKQLVVAENKKIFDILYRNEKEDYDVPRSFPVKLEKAVMQEKRTQGFSAKTFILSVFPILKNNTLQPGVFLIIYKEDCEHLQQYMPLWDNVEQFCDKYRTGIYEFQKYTYKNAQKMLKDANIVVDDLPLVRFIPHNVQIAL